MSNILHLLSRVERLMLTSITTCHSSYLRRLNVLTTKSEGVGDGWLITV